MTFTIRPGVREKIGLLFGVGGPSGSGKTYTALLLATGIGGKIGMIDTEAGRALHYAPPPGKKANPAKGTFDFLHLDFSPPFTPERYVDAVRALEEEGVNVIVIDSMTHEWLGEGGCSDIQAAEAERMAKDKKTGEILPWKLEVVTAPSWKIPKRRHTRMMSRFVQTRTHIIFCFRAQVKVKLVKRPGEGTEVVPIGFQPLCEKNFPYELSGSFLLHPNKPGCPDYSLPHKLNADLQNIFRDGELVGIEAGRRLKEWSEVGETRPPEDKAAIGARDLLEKIEDAGVKVAELIATPEIEKQIKWLEKNRHELAKQVQQAIDAALASGVIGEESEEMQT